MRKNFICEKIHNIDKIKIIKNNKLRSKSHLKIFTNSFEKTKLK